VAEVTPSARRLRVASVLLGVFAAAVLVWMVGPIQDTADNTREVRRTTDAVNEAVTAIRDSADLTSCRAQMSAQIVGQAQDRGGSPVGPAGRIPRRGAGPVAGS
jgi:hypothetical protein